MALSTPIGMTFELRRDWRALFSKESWFMYQRNFDADKCVLRRFTIFNVAKFYFFRTVIALLSVTLRPLAILAWHYWYNTEGEDFKTLTGAAFYVRSSKGLPKFFNLDSKPTTNKDINSQGDNE